MNTEGISILIRKSDVPGKIPTVSDLQLAELAINTYDGELYAKRQRIGIGTDIVRLGAGPTVTNILYVTKDGNDGNTGRKLGDAKATIEAAVAEATIPGTIIKVSPGSYIVNNPIFLSNEISIIGDSLRDVIIIPQNDGDIFYVGHGNYIANMSFNGGSNTGAVFSFDPYNQRYITQSPYIQNCTNFISNSIGLRIDGNYALGTLKSMVLDSYTQYNQGGIGVSITNGGYAQLVSLFTICNDTAVYCGSGGACDLTNSNSSFGNYGLVSEGIGSMQYNASIVNPINANSDTFKLKLNPKTLTVSNAIYDNITGILTAYTNDFHNLSVGVGVSIAGIGFTSPSNPTTPIFLESQIGYNFNVGYIPNSTSFEVNVGTSTSPYYYYSGGTVKIDAIRPFDGQVVYFQNLYYTLSEIVITSGGNGYTSTPIVTIDAPSTEWGVTAQVVATIDGDSVIGFEIVSNGRGYTSIPNIKISSPNTGINTATAVAVLLPTYYSIKKSTPVSSGICTITINENLPYSVGIGTEVSFFKQSRILASGHSFEYIGSGTEIATALPITGGVPIQENEIDMRNGGLVVYTSTDQSGNFRIGDGVAINQNTGTISGTFYSKSLFSTMTPFILALGGD